MSNEWRECTLGDVVNFRRGHDLPKSKMKSGRYPVMGSNGVIGFHNEFTTKSPCVSIGRSGNVGNPKILKQDCWAHNTTLYIDDFKGNDPLYVYYLLHRLNLANYKGGSAVPTLNRNHIHPIELSIPPLQEQKSIAYILGTLDDKIELNRKMNETLEQMAQALFKSWFEDFDPVLDNAIAKGNSIPDALKPKAEQRKEVLASGKYKASPKELMKLFPSSFEFNEELDKWIPEGWEVSTVGQEFNVTMGQSPPGSSYNEKELGMPFFQGKTDFGFRFPTNRIYCTEPKRTANKNDTLISVRAPVGNANLALSDCSIGRGLAALRHKSKSISFTYYSILELKEIFDVFEGEGTVFGSINQTDLKNISVIKSDPQIIEKYDFIAKSYDQKIEINENQISSLTQQRDVLLPQLISGKLKPTKQL
uniref:restriction endonuclease subunit S n=1 Tax=uncultured Tenacibaculum sp. TaxID=174713 RepID=UPI00261BC29A|nr:restriction endonuclease subunit S [uncultured Tenacibaculum sp.]